MFTCLNKTLEDNKKNKKKKLTLNMFKEILSKSCKNLFLQTPRLSLCSAVDLGFYDSMSHYLMNCCRTEVLFVSRCLDLS